MLEKIYKILLELNCYFLVLAAIFTVVSSPIGSPLFCYTSTIGLIDGIKIKSRQGIIINSTFLAMNTYFVIRNFIS